MSLALSGDTIAFMAGLGLTPEQMKGLVDHLQRDAMAFTPAPSSNGVNEERERLRNENTKAERKRAADRERMAAKREAERVARESRDSREAVACENTSKTNSVAQVARDVAATVARYTRDESSDTDATRSDPATPRTCERAQVVIPTSSLRSEAYPPVSPNGLTAPRGAETARGSRIPENWSPIPDYDPAAYGLTREQHDAELAKFLDYWRSVPGAKGRKSDWPATWRNWMRRASENQTRKASHDRPHDDKLTRKQANLTRAFTASQRVAGHRGEP